jgi:hypothetical protein
VKRRSPRAAGAAERRSPEAEAALLRELLVRQLEVAAILVDLD